jgi:hypothetical protein
MITYVARPLAMFDDITQQMEWSRPDTLTVFEPDDNSRKTGIVDHRGHPIYAVSQTGPIGFLTRG